MLDLVDDIFIVVSDAITTFSGIGCRRRPPRVELGLHGVDLASGEEFLVSLQSLHGRHPDVVALEDALDGAANPVDLLLGRFRLIEGEGGSQNRLLLQPRPRRMNLGPAARPGQCPGPDVVSPDRGLDKVDGLFFVFLDSHCR